MLGIYFSGTGNTRYCMNIFLRSYGEKSQPLAIEDDKTKHTRDYHDLMKKSLQENEFIVLAYPIYYSNLPKIVYDFIVSHQDEFKGKKVFLVATMGLFSGDGTGCGARLLKKYGADIVGGLHIKMPDCVGDVKLLKKSIEENKEIVKEAERKIVAAVKSLKEGNPPQEGLGVLAQLAGLFGQRLWFINKTRRYSNKLKIDASKCVGCGKCSQLCPMHNIDLTGNKAVPKGKCTMCYRCISNCPKKAITLIGKEVYEQCKVEQYI